MSKPSNPFRLDVNDAVAYTTTWRAIHGSNNSMPLAFTVLHSEMLDVLGELPVTANDIAFRFYLGYKQVEVDVLGKPTLQIKPCLAIVPVVGFVVDPGGMVTSAGEELIQLEIVNNGLLEWVSGVFDFTYPCPTTCQVDSPLKTGIIPPPHPGPGLQSKIADQE